MNTIKLSARALCAFGFLALLAASANASPVTYDFTVTATSGPLSGVTATGSFTFDSSLEVPKEFDQTVPLKSLHFTWNGITYSAATANIGNLLFDSSGALKSADFGDHCHGGCGVAHNTNDWWVNGGNHFLYSTPSYQRVGFGTVTLRRRTCASVRCALP